MTEFMEDDALHFGLVEGSRFALVEALEIERSFGLGGINDAVLAELRPIAWLVIGHPDLQFAAVGIALAGSAHLAEIELNAHGRVVGPGCGDLGNLRIYLVTAAHETYAELCVSGRPLDELAVDTLGTVRNRPSWRARSWRRSCAWYRRPAGRPCPVGSWASAAPPPAMATNAVPVSDSMILVAVMVVS